MSPMTAPKTTPPAWNAKHPTHFVDQPGKLVLQAHEYFDSLGLAESAAEDFNPTMADSDGLVSYIVGTSNPPAPIQALYDEVKPIMEGLTNVVVSAVLKKANGDPKIQHDPATWRLPMQAMVKAFCGGFSEASQHYDQQIYGVEIANKFINILLDAVVNQGAALSGFTKFLQSQGQTIRTEISVGQKSYLYASVSICHEIFEAADGRFIYVPKFKSYFTHFVQDTFKVTSACVSVDSFKFLFDLDIMTGAFMVETWKADSEFRKLVKDFIQKFQKANIKDSENYFDGIFDSNPA
jgi:Virulence factor Evf